MTRSTTQPLNFPAPSCQPATSWQRLAVLLCCCLSCCFHTCPAAALHCCPLPSHAHTPQIASALDAILARQLDPPAAGSSKPDQHPAGAAAASSSPKRKQQSAAAATEAGAGDTGDAGADADDDATGVQLFRAVPKGTPCVILQDSCGLEGAWEQHTQQHQHTNSSAALQPMQRPPPLRDVIPRLSLAERSKAAGKRKFERVLSELAVDGAALMSAAAAAGYGGVLKAGSSPSPAAATGGSGVDGGSSKPAVGGSKAAGGGKGAAAASTTAAWVKGFKRVKGGQKVQGVVVDAKEWVSHDVRVAKLLGTQVGPACR